MKAKEILVHKSVSLLQLSTFTVVISALLINSSYQQCLTSNDARPHTSVMAFHALYTGQQDFSFSLLSEINKLQTTKNDNVFFSPYSTYHALLLAYFISANQTEKSLHEVLRFGADQDKQDVLQAYRVDKWSNAPYEFSNANRFFVSKQIHVRDCMSDLFGEELQSLDIAKDPLAALETINDWVEGQTRGMIKNLLPPDAVDASTNLVLVNAAYFKGLWEYTFPVADTHKNLFYITPSESTFVEMMTQEGTFNNDISETLGAHILEMPYKGESASMYVFLPPFSTKNGVENVLARLNAQTFSRIVSEESTLVPRKVILSFPKFALERTIELGPVLREMGVGDLLTDHSDLSTLTGVRNVTLGRAIHKARVEVTEEGTKAAAATALFTFRSSRPSEPYHFECNHPFIYVIYDKSKKAILFLGIFRRP